MKTVTASSPFQFHKGAIRTALADITARFHSNFNSIKVRLELGER